ncbi:class I SAM-dependent methyltransferase [Manganibacter manganicus]|uniref:Methyltransferase n=1 Tax=Manganibacter manganicus TaxID=1873176 RepID=A0A1V8RPB5_9HYPH|nr:class I SAM-dependent methyltransferase [Pseudaminobacter manganicus]OQM74809.1 methyltransferase [Pseudaminobacter manganicus]
MASDVLRTLLHPFEVQALPLPAKGARTLFLGAEPGFRPPQGFDTTLHLVQGFRPSFRVLQSAGFAVEPRPSGVGYAGTLVLAGRHRGQNELRVAEALERTAPEGLIVVAGGKDDGIASLRKAAENHVVLDGYLPKYHGGVFWFRGPSDIQAAAALRANNPSSLVEGRFRTAPGMFSFEKIDVGSKLLTETLPSDLGGQVADFCAGWGYLSAEIVGRFPSVTGIDLYEADFESLEAAKVNVGAEKAELGFFWIDLTAEPVERRYDVIVMNPPFHRSRAAEPKIGAAIIRTAAKALRPGGRLFMVANRQLPYEATLASAFASHSELANDGKFKVLTAAIR